MPTTLLQLFRKMPVSTTTSNEDRRIAAGQIVHAPSVPTRRHFYKVNSEQTGNLLIGCYVILRETILDYMVIA